MEKCCQQFNISVQRITDIHPGYLDLLFRKLVPDEQFRFITFETSGYRSCQLTCLLYNYIPETVLLTVENAADIEPAMQQLQLLNPDVEWSGARLKHLHKGQHGISFISIELLLSAIPMRVSAGGDLIAL